MTTTLCQHSKDDDNTMLMASAMVKVVMATVTATYNNKDEGWQDTDGSGDDGDA